MWEETGWRPDKVGPWVWSRRHTWRGGDKWYDSIERFYLYRIDNLTVEPAVPDDTLLGAVLEHRWWTVAQIQAATGSEVFVPSRMGDLLTPILAGDVPEIPIDAGI